jgi:hypothetical protein
MADNGRLTVGQKVKVLLFYVRFAYTNGNHNERRLQFALWAMEEQHMVFLWGFLREKVFQRRPENVAQLRAHE